ncbi:cytochrome P450 [Actinoallomurus liliacearum]|uniref:Cytochrome P450 n=1 Tax=Actinoallomurus liliacearum TaxID=1080073 RepID=A0ABP8TH36_9ACTN
MTEPAPATASADVSPGGCPAHADVLPLYGPRFLRNPSELYREMRQEHGSVVPVVLEGDIPAWFVIGYREVHHVLSHPEVFARDCRRWNEWDNIPPDWPLRPFVGYQPSTLFAEGDEHRRRAGAISNSLFVVDQFDLRNKSEKIADELIDAFAMRGEAELMAEYAHPLPLLVLARMFGLPEAETPGLLRDMMTTVNGDEGALDAYQGICATMERLVAHKAEQPGADFVTRMMNDSADLTEEELIADLVLVMTAAQQPMAYWIGNTVRLMLTDDRFSLNLAGGRRSVGQALNEVLWEDTPTQNYLGRWAARPVHLGGQQINTGDLLVLGLAAANSDPRVRPAADAPAVGNQAMMSFSYGEHRCPFPAPELAEVICEAAVEVLLDRLPDVLLAVDPGDLEWSPSVWMRGLVDLPVRFAPSYVSG